MQFADTAPVMSWMAGTDARCYYFNQVWLDFTERTLELERMLGWAEGVHPEDFQGCWDTYLTGFATRQKFQMEYRRLRADGEYRWILDTGVPRFEPDGSFAGYIGACVDITERKLAELALFESEARLRLALKVADLGIWDWEIKTGFVTWSSLVESMFGLAPGANACIKEAFLDCLHPEDRNLVTEVIAHSVEAGVGYDLEYRIVLPDGTVRWIRGKGDVLRSETGRVVRMINTVMDITAAKQKVMAAQESHNLLLAVIEGTPDPIFVQDLQGRYLMMNSGGARFLGKSVEEIIGKHTTELFPPDTARILMDVKRKVITTGETHRAEQDVTVMGITRTTISTISLYRDSQGNVIGLVGIARDISDRKQAEEALRNAKEQLELKVFERTTELRNANKQLQGEAAERKQSDQALRQSEARFRELAQREELLNRLASQIRSSLDLNIILETAVQEIYSLLKIERCLFIWYRPDEEAPYWEIVQEARNLALPSHLGFRSSVTQLGSLTTKAFNKKINRVDDARALSDPVERQFFLSMGVTATLEISIHTKSGEIGVISCGHTSKPRLWSDSEVELLQAVADQLAIAIDQAELYKQSRTAAATAQAQAAQLAQTLLELQQTQAQLIQTEKMSSLGQLVAGVAHEINNPVNFIYGNLTHADEYIQNLLHLLHLYQQHYPHPVPEIQDENEAIDLEFLLEDLPKLLSSMKVGAERIREIVLSLRNFSRLDEAKMKPIEIHSGIDSTLLILQHLLQHQPEYSGIQVIKEYGNLPEVECYAGQLNQVFMNILSNAIDALEHSREFKSQANTQRIAEIGSSHSIIRISTSVLNNERVQIRIADNGPGMTEAVRQRLFDPFFTTKPVGKGTGLGLSISYQIVVKKHSGSLECISAPGQGAEFVISIPIRQASQSAARER